MQERHVDRRHQRRHVGRPPRQDHLPDRRPTPTPRTTRWRPARATPRTSRRGGSTEAQDNYATTLDVDDPRLVPLRVQRPDDPLIGGDENMQLRQAISQAIDREEINDAVYNGTRTTSHRHHACRASRASKKELCEYCAYDPEAAQQRVRRVEGGRRLAEPARSRSSSTPVPATRTSCDHHRQPDGDRHPGRGRAVPDGDVLQPPRRRAVPDLPLRLVRRLPDVRQLHVRPVPHRLARWQQPRLLATRSSTTWSTQAKAETVDPDEQAELFQQAEKILLNDRHRRIPINWYTGDYVYNQENIANFPQTNFGLITLGAGRASAKLMQSRTA